MSDRSVEEKDCFICQIQKDNGLCEGHHNSSPELIVEYLKVMALMRIEEKLPGATEEIMQDPLAVAAQRNELTKILLEGLALKDEDAKDDK